MQTSPVAVKLWSRAAVYYNSLTKRKLFQWFTPAGSCLHHICKSGTVANVLSMVLLENLISAYYCPLEIIVLSRKSLCDEALGARPGPGLALVWFLNPITLFLQALRLVFVCVFCSCSDSITIGIFQSRLTISQIYDLKWSGWVF